jgi:hypothetical protein
MEDRKSDYIVFGKRGRGGGERILFVVIPSSPQKNVLDNEVVCLIKKTEWCECIFT